MQPVINAYKVEDEAHNKALKAHTNLMNASIFSNKTLVKVEAEKATAAVKAASEQSDNITINTLRSTVHSLVDFETGHI